MICPRCGVINTDDAERCTRCRGSLAPAPVQSAESPAAAVDAPTPPAPAPQPPAPLPPPPPVPTPAWDPTPGQWQAPPPPAGPVPWPPPPAGTAAPAPPPSWAPPPTYGSAPAWSPEGQDSAPGWPGQPPPAPPGPWQPPAPRQAKRRPEPATWPGPSDDRTWKPERALPTYLPWAVLCTILLFPIGGIVAIVYGVLVGRRTAAGDYEGASKASRLARLWCLISVGVGLIVLIALASGVVKNPYTTN